MRPFVTQRAPFKMSACWSVAETSSYLAHRDGQGLNDLLVRHGNNALTVYLDDPVSDTDPASLGDAPSHQAADLEHTARVRQCFLLRKAKTNNPQIRLHSRCHSEH